MLLEYSLTSCHPLLFNTSSMVFCKNDLNRIGRSFCPFFRDLKKGAKLFVFAGFVNTGAEVVVVVVAPKPVVPNAFNAIAEKMKFVIQTQKSINLFSCKNK